MINCSHVPARWVLGGLIPRELCYLGQFIKFIFMRFCPHKNKKNSLTALNNDVAKVIARGPRQNYVVHFVR